MIYPIYRDLQKKYGDNYANLCVEENSLNEDVFPVTFLAVTAFIIALTTAVFSQLMSASIFACISSLLTVYLTKVLSKISSIGSITHDWKKPTDEYFKLLVEESDLSSSLLPITTFNAFLSLLIVLLVFLEYYYPAIAFSVILVIFAIIYYNNCSKLKTIRQSKAIFEVLSD